MVVTPFLAGNLYKARGPYAMAAMLAAIKKINLTADGQPNQHDPGIRAR